MKNKILPYLIIVLTFVSITQWLNIDTSNLTVIWWGIYLSILSLFISSKKLYFKGQSTPFFIKLFLILIGFEFLNGIVLAEGYWDFKALINNALAFLLCLSIYVYSTPQLLSKTLSIWFKLALIAFFLFLPIMQPEAPAKYLIPILFISLFIKPLPFKTKLIILLFFSFVFIFGGLGARSSVIKYLIALLMGVSVYTNIYKSKIIIRIAHGVLMFLPFVLLIVGLLGVFNVFKFDEYLPKSLDIEVTNSYDKDEKENLNADTRTFIYEEAIISAINGHYVMLGNSLSRGYKSPYFGDGDFYGRGERYNSEVSIINVFTHFGIIGVLVYFGIFYMATYKAIYQSKNNYIIMLGVYVSFRWVFSWIEDFSRFDLNYMFIWIMISMCFSEQFRSMNNKQFEFWVRGIFEKRYRRLEFLINKRKMK
ncbi:hypothetical protein [Algibacter sp. L4_22]|uniref:hypothetical protein n=1 Tax=Algibacter sp. L4_22 TaxID=2942477 RepID=UPI00201B6D44|nr:hypothetical protein [Algibacter sp. L4_22]MCL5129861.1 hypothetical protein [Algibacter sp. L4_22]